MVVVFPEGMPKKEKSRVVVVSESDMHSFDREYFPSKYFIINAFGEGVFFKTRNRKYAQTLSDKIYGAGHYVIRQLEGAFVGKSS